MIFLFVAVFLSISTTLTASEIAHADNLLYSKESEYSALGYGLQSRLVKKNALQVKGDPKITFCNSSTSSNYFVVDSFSFSPKDIHSNENVTLSLIATLKEVVTDGKIMFKVTITTFHIPVLSKTVDLCEESAKGGIDCPLQPKRYNISQVVPIPSIPLHGEVTANVNINDDKGNNLLCVQVVVHV